MSDERNNGGGAMPGGAGSGQRGAPASPEVRAVLLVGALSMAIGALGSAAVVGNAPRIKQWWSARAVPAAQAMRQRVRGHEAGSPGAPFRDGGFRDGGFRDGAQADSVILTRSTLRDFTRRVDAAVAATLDDAAPTGWVHGPAKQNLVDVLLAASIIADRMRTRADDDRAAEAHLPELESAMGRLSTERVVHAVNHAIGSDSAPLAGDSLTIFARVFDGGHREAGRYVPVRQERVVAALRLSRSIVPLPFGPSAPGESGEPDRRPRQR